MLPHAGLCAAEKDVVLGKWTEKALEQLMTEGAKISDEGKRVAFLSEHFLGGSYKRGTLTGSASKKELLTINLKYFDCFTFLDYIEAMRRSSTYRSFEEELRRVRYRQGNVSYFDRNHFFSDWKKQNANYIEDVTGKVGGNISIKTRKNLNFIPDIEARARTLSYIPCKSLDETIRAKLRTGDYIGIFSTKAGLDVSHTGILIKREAKLTFRHASSRKGSEKIVDEDLMEYIADKPGIIVLRPKHNIPVPTDL